MLESLVILKLCWNSHIGAGNRRLQWIRQLICFQQRLRRELEIVRCGVTGLLIGEQIGIDTVDGGDADSVLAAERRQLDRRIGVVAVLAEQEGRVRYRVHDVGHTNRFALKTQIVRDAVSNRLILLVVEEAIVASEGMLVIVKHVRILLVV